MVHGQGGAAMIDDPEDYDDYCEQECEHLEYGIDILSGFARCEDCGHGWIATDAEIQHQIDMQAAYDRVCAQIETDGLAIEVDNKSATISDDDIPF
jgi:hypothetical protein